MKSDFVRFRAVGKINRIRSQYPLRKVVSSYQNTDGDMIDILECGHEFKVPDQGEWHSYGDDFYRAKKHRCKDCGIGGH